jgi:hypothetical protein
VSSPLGYRSKPGRPTLGVGRICLDLSLMVERFGW